MLKCVNNKDSSEHNLLLWFFCVNSAIGKKDVSVFSAVEVGRRVPSLNTLIMHLELWWWVTYGFYMVLVMSTPSVTPGLIQMFHRVNTVKYRQCLLCRWIHLHTDVGTHINIHCRSSRCHVWLLLFLMVCFGDCCLTFALWMQWEVRGGSVCWLFGLTKVSHDMVCYRDSKLIWWYPQ